jgi:hypothetical protein
VFYNNGRKTFEMCFGHSLQSSKHLPQPWATRNIDAPQNSFQYTNRSSFPQEFVFLHSSPMQAIQSYMLCKKTYVCLTLMWIFSCSNVLMKNLSIEWVEFSSLSYDDECGLVSKHWVIQFASKFTNDGCKGPQDLAIQVGN